MNKNNKDSIINNLNLIKKNGKITIKGSIEHLKEFHSQEFPYKKLQKEHNDYFFNKNRT